VDDDPEFGESDASASAIAAGLGAVEELIRSAGSKNLDARQFVVSVIALCFFPFVHEGSATASTDSAGAAISQNALVR
jgi:hypothetical protein